MTSLRFYVHVNPDLHSNHKIYPHAYRGIIMFCKLISFHWSRFESGFWGIVELNVRSSGAFVTIREARATCACVFAPRAITCRVSQDLRNLSCQSWFSLVSYNNIYRNLSWLYRFCYVLFLQQNASQHKVTTAPRQFKFAIEYDLDPENMSMHWTWFIKLDSIGTYRW